MLDFIFTLAYGFSLVAMMLAMLIMSIRDDINDNAIQRMMVTYFKRMRRLTNR